MISRNIYITTTTEFVHQYQNAPEEVSYLRYPHRHLLKITVCIEVYSEDRELEFIIVKHKINNYISSTFSGVTDKSCENLASLLLSYVQAEYGTDRDVSITISEDDENGAILKYTRER